jgi:hypothetical protein
MTSAPHGFKLGGLGGSGFKQDLVLGEGTQFVEGRARSESRLKGFQDKPEEALGWRAGGGKGGVAPEV